MKFYLFFLSSFIIFQTAFAATAQKPNIYMRSTGGFSPDIYLLKDDREVKVKRLSVSEEAKDLFVDNEISYEYINEFDENGTKAHIAIWGGLGLALLYGMTANSETYSSGAFSLIYLTGLTAGLYYIGEAESSFYKAINTYNNVPEELSYNKKAPRQMAPRLSYSWTF